MKIDRNPATTAFASRRDKSGITCTHCLKTGHPIEKCWEKNPELKPKRLRGKQRVFNTTGSGDAIAASATGNTEKSAGSTAPSPPAFQAHTISAFTTRTDNLIDNRHWHILTKAGLLIVEQLTALLSLKKRSPTTEYTVIMSR